jgi:hypothetical protein
MQRKFTGKIHVRALSLPFSLAATPKRRNIPRNL